MSSHLMSTHQARHPTFDAVGGTAVTLASGDTTAVTVPATVTVPAGQTTASFSMNTVPVTASKTVTVSGSLGGVQKDVSVRVDPVALVSAAIAPSRVESGGSAVGTVTLNGRAPGSGLTVTLVSADASAASVPASITIGAGQQSGTFPAKAGTVSASKSVQITATAGASSAVAMPNVAPKAVNLAALAIGSATMKPGATVPATVTLSAPAPAGGLAVALSSNDTTAVGIPASVTVAAGATTASFQVVAKPVTA